MQRTAAHPLLRLALCLLAVAALGGCSGYASAPGGSSGVQVYGTVDTGVVHESR